jgi:predicted ATP-dependent endonuclease of OLD family
MNLQFNVSQDSNLVTFCGQNNIGKTNILRSINIFFNPDKYNPQTDIPTLKMATWGGSVQPKIEITFVDDKNQTFYCITRDFEPNKKKTTTGFSFNGSLNRKTNCKDLSHGLLQFSLTPEIGGSKIKPQRSRKKWGTKRHTTEASRKKR